MNKKIEYRLSNEEIEEAILLYIDEKKNTAVPGGAEIFINTTDGSPGSRGRDYTYFATIRYEQPEKNQS